MSEADHDHNMQSHICTICTDSEDTCNTLHIYYLIGSILTMCGCMFVMATYMYNAKLREHPAVLIFSRCIFDFLFGLCFFIQFFLSPTNLACDQKPCSILGAIILFCFLSSQGYFAASIRDLYNSVRNPFSQPHKDVTKIHLHVFFIALALTLFVHFYYSFAYRLDLQYCAISPSTSAVNPYNLMLIYIPVSLLVFTSIAVNIYAIRRLRVGLEDTFYIRMQSIKDSLFYCLGYSFYFIVLGLCYFMVWNDDRINDDADGPDETGWHYFFALTVAFLGLDDFGLWLYRQYSLSSTKMQNKVLYAKIANVTSLSKPARKQSLRRNKLVAKQFIAPALPQHIAYMDEQSENSNEETSECGQCCKRLSFMPTVGDESINKALRREVLAYTTDGIAQSIDRQCKAAETYYTKHNLDLKAGLHDEDYAESRHDAHGRSVQRFNIVIKHNRHLLYEDAAESESDAEESSCGLHTDDENDQDEDEKQRVVHRVVTKLILGAETADNGKEEGIGDGEGRQFVDFAPMVFKYIRNHVLGISDESYNSSIIPQDKYAQRNVLDAKYGEGKSGAFFYFSHDSRYLVKTINKLEVEVMLNTLREYVEFIVRNPSTILSRVVGLHSIRLYGLTKYFLVTENVFLSKLKPSEVYDLKGSWVSRYTKYSLQSGKTLKDGDLKRFIVLNEKCREELINQLSKDSQFLASCNIMDYSLLLGIYHLKMVAQIENEDDEKYAHAIKKYAGGVRAEIVEGPGLYYMGIIDTLQVYNLKKKLENFVKTYIKRDDANGISCVEPVKYQKRFMNYMNNIIVTDKEYFQELNIPKKQFENQTVLVYPGKDTVARCIKEAQSVEQH